MKHRNQAAKYGPGVEPAYYDPYASVQTQDALMLKYSYNFKLCYTAREAQETLHIAHQKFQDLISSGQLKSYKIGRRRYVSGEALIKFIRARESAEESAA